MGVEKQLILKWTSGCRPVRPVDTPCSRNDHAEIYDVVSNVFCL
jgi:hypothetical protein